MVSPFRAVPWYEPLRLIDEVLTPDSSRFWDVREYRTGISPPSFDKQIVRDWLPLVALLPDQPPLVTEAAAVAGMDHLRLMNELVLKLFQACQSFTLTRFSTAL